MKSKFLPILTPLIAFVLYVTLSSSSAGYTGYTTTGCNCHGSSNSNTLISISGLPAGGYISGAVYTLTLTVTNTVVVSASPNGKRDGFNLKASSGFLASGVGSVLSGTELKHSAPKAATTGTASWTFNWTAPSSGSNTITFNVAANAADGDGTFNNDQCNLYSTTLIKAPALAVTASAPSIACNGGVSTITASATGSASPYTYKLNAGSYQSSNVFTNNVAGTYTITAMSSNSATASTTVTITQPSLIAFNAPTITNAVCNGGVGSATATANGGTGTKTYTINPLGPQSNTTGSFTNLTAQTYTISVSDANSCVKTTVITVTQPAPLTVTSSNVSGCSGNAISLIGSPAGGVFSVSNPYTGPNTTYTYTYTNGSGCSATSIPSTITNLALPTISASPSAASVCQNAQVTLAGNGAGAGGFYSWSGGITNNVAFNAASTTTYTLTGTDANTCSNTTTVQVNVTPVSAFTIAMPLNSSYCQTINQNAGTNNYVNTNCELIAQLTATGIGPTNICVNFLPGNPSWNGEPYANRVYSITPSTQPSGSANVCLYYTAADLLAAGISTNSDISITKVGGNGILGGSGTVIEIPNSAMSITTFAGGNIEACFPVTSFSSFYLHSKNLNNIPLPVSFGDFSVKESNQDNELNWSTLQEHHNAYFNVQYSADGIHFNTIGKINSRAEQGNSNTLITYTFTHEKVSTGMQYYRLQQVDLDGKYAYSSTISIRRNADNSPVLIYPNPNNGDFSIISSSLVDMQVVDMSGTQLFEQKNTKEASIHLSKKGMYLIILSDNQGNKEYRKLSVY
jgi:hypothetical protein